MSRYVNNIPTTLSREEAGAVIVDYMAAEGFVRKQRDGEDLWQKGGGWLIAPQFLKCQPVDGSVQLEAWVAGFAILPGIFVGEVDCMSTGVWAALPKSQLKPRVESLQRRLSSAQGSATAAAASAQASAPGWYPDPTGRHELRHWDGTSWTQNVSDGGQTSVDASMS